MYLKKCSYYQLYIYIMVVLNFHFFQIAPPYKGSITKKKTYKKCYIYIQFLKIVIVLLKNKMSFNNIFLPRRTSLVGLVWKSTRYLKITKISRKIDFSLFIFYVSLIRYYSDLTSLNVWYKIKKKKKILFFFENRDLAGFHPRPTHCVSNPYKHLMKLIPGKTWSCLVILFHTTFGFDVPVFPCRRLPGSLKRR